METIKPIDIKRGMIIHDECNETVYTALADAQYMPISDDDMHGYFYVKGIALTNWGSVIEFNPSYLPEDGELFVVSHPAPFILPMLPSRKTVQTLPTQVSYGSHINEWVDSDPYTDLPYSAPDDKEE